MVEITCPICGTRQLAAKASDLPDAPFCSPRCRQIDFGRWLGGDYNIPVHPDEVTRPDEDPDMFE